MNKLKLAAIPDDKPVKVTVRPACADLQGLAELCDNHSPDYRRDHAARSHQAHRSHASEIHGNRQGISGS